mmetsp:Transcript_83728/g.200875  ORF Transcript_83728/g.200875 Transcript_83728/m.200875 type:complete len:178 (-) Transcript_83728:74-607(-)
MLRSVLNLFLVCSPDLHLAATFDQEHATQKHMQVQVSADGSLASALQVMRRQKDGLALKGEQDPERVGNWTAPATKEAVSANQTARPVNQSMTKPATSERHWRRKHLLQTDKNKVSLASVLVFGIMVTTALTVAGLVLYLLVAPRIVTKRRPISQMGAASPMYRRSLEKEAALNWAR